MMDFSFVDDPEFIKKREAQWEIEEPSIKEGLTKKEVQGVRDYFMTGRKTASTWIRGTSLLQCFPIINVESIQYVLRHYIPAKITNDDRRGLHCVIAGMLFSQLDETEKLALHNDLFGEVYNPDQLFPFYIADQTALEPLRYSAEQYLEAYLLICSTTAMGMNSQHCKFWLDKPNFFLTLLNTVADDFFYDSSVEIQNQFPGIFNPNRLKRMWISFCGYALNPPTIKESPYKEKLLAFIAVFKNHMEIAELKPALADSWARHKKEAGL